MAKSGPKDFEALTYAEASAELDAIVGYFERPDVDIDELVVKLERAASLIDELDRRLVATKMQVDELAPRLARISADDDVDVVDPETGEILDA